MTECCDVRVAHSPPLFTSHNAKPELVLYQNIRLVMTQKQSPLSVRRYNARSSSSPTRDDRQGAQAKPRRPCLVIRTDSEGSIGSTSSSGSSSSSSSDENEPSSPTRRKKKVVFADDRGLSLTQVRLMNEPSNQPPKLMTVSPYLNQQSSSSSLSSASSAAAAGAAGAGAVSSTVGEQQWQLRFPQPASCYLDFRRRLDENNISLENVIVKSPDRRIVGTVKVRNLSYDKEVFVRSTQDSWTTHRDTLCVYVQNNAMVGGGGGGGHGGHGGHGCNGNGCAGSAPNVTAIYDTFSFRLPLPAHAASVEFAVCYKSTDFECWDSNDGHNYWLSLGNGCSSARGPAAASQSLHHQHHQHHLHQPQRSDVVADFDHLQPPTAVHYFGAQSRQNTWNVWRDHKDNDSSAYW